MKATKLNYQMLCFIDTVMYFGFHYLKEQPGSFKMLMENILRKILIINSSSCSAFSSFDMFFLHAIRRQNMTILSVCLLIAHVTAICRNPHKLSNLDSPLRGSWVTNTTSVKMFSPEKKIVSPFIFVTNYRS
jgi:hypothetical protein